jgi:hypothetical protein
MPSFNVPTICPYCSCESAQKANQASCSSQDDHEFWYYHSSRTNKVIWYIEINEYIIDPRGIRLSKITDDPRRRPIIFEFAKSIPLDQAVTTLKRFIAMKAFS